jgi:hypothetical protein
MNVRQAVSQELDFSQREFSRPILDLLKVIRGQVEASVGNAEALRPLLLCARLVCRIFFSLNAFGLSEHMEVQLSEWMNEFLALLKVDTNVLDDSDPEKETPLESVKVGVFLCGRGLRGGCRGPNLCPSLALSDDL